MAQKPADINLEELKKLAILNPTVEEICAYFNVSKPTVIKYLRRKEYKEALEHGRSNRKTSLKRYQWQLAAKGNCAMLIWLGKNELGQRDKPEDTFTIDELMHRFADHITQAKAATKIEPNGHAKESSVVSA
jgi:hypothetical protein